MSTTPKKPSEEQHLDPKAQAEHHDEVLVVPAGQRRWRFYFTFGVIIFVLLTFMVADLVVPALGVSRNAERTYVAWTSTDGVRHEMGEREFMLEKRKLVPLVGFAFGSREREPSDEQTTAFLVLEEEAARAGVRATDADVSKFIKDSFQSKEQYQGVLRMYGLSSKEFEGIVRRVMRYRRYELLISQAADLPDPAAVEKRWKGMHQEYAFDYVELPIASLESEARAQAPDAAGLKAWYEALPEAEKLPFRTQETVAAELAAFPLEAEFDATRLFAKYPRPADEDAEAKAKAFQAGFSYVLYRREKPEPGQDFRKTWEESRDDALRQAPIYDSLMDWQKSVAERLGRGEAVDFGAEAAELGLTYRNQIDPLSRQGWTDLGVPWIGRYVADHMFDPGQTESVFRAVVVDAKGFVLGRVTKKLAPRLPEYAEVEAAVLDAWGRMKAKEIALSKLEAVRDQLGTRPDPNDAAAPPFKPEVDQAAFVAAVQAAGLEVQRREWAEQSPPPDPQGESDAAQFFRSSPALYSHKVGSVPKPEVNRAGTKVYLVHLDGIRDPDVARMMPNDVQQIGMQLASQDRMQFRQTQLVSKAALQERYQAHLRAWDTSAPQ